MPRGGRFGPVGVGLLLLSAVCVHSADEAEGDAQPALPFAPPAWDDATFGVDGASANRKHVLCERFKMVYNKSIPLRDGLRNQTLSTLWPRVEGYVPERMHAVDRSGALTNVGLMTEMFDEVSRRAGFSWRNAYAFHELPGATDTLRGEDMRNKTWSDVLHWGAQNYDMCIGWFPELVTYKNEGLLFPESWFDSSLVLITESSRKREDFIQRAFKWIEPFSMELWFMLVLSWFGAGSVYWFVEHSQEEFYYDVQWKNILLSIAHTALEFAGFKFHHPKTFAGRLFTFVWLFFRIVIIASYTAHLASSFVSSTFSTVAVNSIAQALENSLPICIEESSIPYDIMLQMYGTRAKLVPAAEQDIFRLMKDGTCTLRCSCANQPVPASTSSPYMCVHVLTLMLMLGNGRCGGGVSHGRMANRAGNGQKKHGMSLPICWTPYQEHALQHCSGRKPRPLHGACSRSD